MIYKTLSLVVMFVLAVGINKSVAQAEPCPCIDDIASAVDAVMQTSGCEETLWEAPHALEVHLAKLQNWCSAEPTKPLKSKELNIVEAMLETIQDAYEGESIPVLDGEPIWIHIPAPDCALEALTALEDVLVNGCAVPE